MIRSLHDNYITNRGKTYIAPNVTAAAYIWCNVYSSLCIKFNQIFYRREVDMYDNTA